MSKFIDDIEARLVAIEREIPTVKLKDRRVLQRERADLWQALRKARTGENSTDARQP